MIDEEPTPTHAGLAVYAEDTGRILMVQRSLDPTDDPAVAGTWEFPGGHIEEDESPIEAAMREFCEETGLPVPDGSLVRDWLSEDGIYQCYILAIPTEADAFDEINPDKEAAHEVNPDDPERRNPDVSAWFTVEQIKSLGSALRPEVAKTDWTLFDRGAHMTTNEDRTKAALHLEPIPETWTARMAAHLAKRVPSKDDEKTPPDLPVDYVPPEDGEEPPVKKDEEKKRPFADAPVPFHAVLAVEGRKTGDGRRFMDNSLSNRPLPLPFTWQKVADSEHKGNVVVAKIERIKNRVPTITQDGEEAMAQVADGHFISNAEASEFIALLAEFGKFGVSIDADSAVFELNEDEQVVDFSDARTSSACAVAIPALYEAWISIGDAPEDWGMDAPDEAAAPEALVASAAPAEMFKVVDATDIAALGEAFKDLAPGRTEDGPGWITNPEDTDRLRDYWVRGPGAAEINWGVPGDFNRCRMAVAPYVKPQHLAGYCANRHYDALGFWPGRPVSGETIGFAADRLPIQDRTPGEMITITASAAPVKAPAAWFADQHFEMGDPRLVEQDDGSYACPFTVLDTGQVFGHIARWGQCHLAYGEYCVSPPRSETGYAHYQTGAVLLDNGKQIAVGGISIGGGHAGPYASARQAAAHYDNSSKIAADVIAYEDDFGIAVAGWVRPGTSPEMVAALRASSVSGDWRPVAGHPQEMIAALAVNVPGFGILRPRVAASSEGQLSLVAAGMVAHGPEKQEFVARLDLEEISTAIAVQLAEFQARRDEIRALASTGGK